MADRKRTEPDWQDIRIFLALGRYGSLSAAARALSVNHATIARRLHALEAAMGEKLVDRRPEGYALTLAGSRALSVAGDMEAAVQTLGRGGTDNMLRGVVRVNAPPGLAQGYLIGRLAELSMRYPGLDIDVATDFRSVSLERHETDIAVRVGRPQDGDILARLLMKIGYGFYGTPKLCRDVEAGAAPVLIGFNEMNAYVPEALWMGRQFPRTRVSFRASDQFAQATAAKAGAGIALLPHYIGRRDPKLRPCALESVPPAREVWLLTRREDRKSPVIGLVVQHLLKAVAADHALFEA
jgi:DNA-binding transcriptional LysR family regulator